MASSTGSVQADTTQAAAATPVTEAPKAEAQGVSTLSSILSGYVTEHLTVTREQKDGDKVIQEGDGYLKGTAKAVLGAVANTILTVASIVECVVTNAFYALANTLKIALPTQYSETADRFVSNLSERAELSTSMVGINASNIINTARGEDAQVNARTAITNAVNTVYGSRFVQAANKLHINGFSVEAKGNTFVDYTVNQPRRNSLPHNFAVGGHDRTVSGGDEFFAPLGGSK